MSKNMRSNSWKSFLLNVPTSWRHVKFLGKWMLNSQESRRLDAKRHYVIWAKALDGIWPVGRACAVLCWGTAAAGASAQHCTGMTNWPIPSSVSWHQVFRIPEDGGPIFCFYTQLFSVFTSKKHCKIKGRFLQQKNSSLEHRTHKLRASKNIVPLFSGEKQPWATYPQVRGFHAEIWGTFFTAKCNMLAEGLMPRDIMSS